MLSLPQSPLRVVYCLVSLFPPARKPLAPGQTAGPSLPLLLGAHGCRGRTLIEDGSPYALRMPGATGAASRSPVRDAWCTLAEVSSARVRVGVEASLPVLRTH
eukprot:753044-Hanusia_phi.AAC.1